MSIPTAEEFRSRIGKKNQSIIEESISDALNHWEDPEHTTAVIKFQRRETALEAVQILIKKGYTSTTQYRDECRHKNGDCEDCRYGSDYDNQSCVHFTGDCSCPKWWDVRISLPNEESEDESD